jgi:hypothetical protein
VLGIDRQQIAWPRAAAMGSASFGSCPYPGEPAPDLGDALDGARPGSIDVIAASDLTLHWVQTPPVSLASFAELKLVAQARCVHLHGGTPSDWRIAADWRADRPFVCAALPDAVCTHIEQLLLPHKLVPLWHSAWSVLSAGLSKALPADGWSAVRSPARVVLWHCRKAQVDCMASWGVDPQQSGGDAARTAIQQKQLEIARAGHVDDDTLHWLDLEDGGDAVALHAGLVRLRTGRQLARDWGAALSEASAALALRSLLP